MLNDFELDRLREIDGHDRLDTLRRRPHVQDIVAKARPEDDLRTLEVPGARGDAHYVLRALLARGWPLVNVFEERDGDDTVSPAGSIGGLPVYASDLYGQWAGVSHAIGCHHHRDLREDDDRTTFAELLEIRRREPNGSGRDRWCSFCGGFSIWRLDASQMTWLRAANELLDIMRSIRWYAGQFPAMQATLGASPTDKRWGDAADRLATHEARLAVLCETEPGLTGYIDVLVEESSVVRRRAEMRRDSR